jgi:class 3 adenylate cyclase
MDPTVAKLVDGAFDGHHDRGQRLTLERPVRTESGLSSKAIELPMPGSEPPRRGRPHASVNQIGVRIFHRRLVAIAFVDVAGFSTLMESDDVGTLSKWKALQGDLIGPRIVEHNGRLLRVVGDGLLVEFQSAVAAVRWSLGVQQAILRSSKRAHSDSLVVRIGINVEDAIVDADDLHGDGINIAARIQQLASPGEVLMTAAVHSYVWNKLAVQFCDLGERKLKNISRPVRIYRLVAADTAHNFPHCVGPKPVWNHRPSIAAILGALFGFIVAWACIQSESVEHHGAPLLNDPSFTSISQLPFDRSPI